MKARGLAAAVALSVVAACTPDKSPQNTAGAPTDSASMASMPGMPGKSGTDMPGSMAGMDMPVTIPKGARFTEADVRFMQGMIAHHAQAIYMSRMAASHNANPRVLRFSRKIDQSQQAEIRLMQDWLVANRQMAPDTSSWRRMTMPGMLTAEQLKTLEASKGAEFDEQFLNLMIQHHNGAIKMVDDLLATPMAAQDVDVSVFANEVVLVQTTEIQLMQQMLANL